LHFFTKYAKIAKGLKIEDWSGAYDRDAWAIVL
jgi:hypothetical protein